MNKVAIIYDWIDKTGGVERLLPVFAEMYPEADYYTSYYNPESAPWARHLTVFPSFMQKLPPGIRKNRILSLPFFPYAFESFSLRTYDLVISVTSSFAKGVITRPENYHVCYLLTPTRYAWGQTTEYLSPTAQVFTHPVLTALRKWDYIAASRPDKIIAISERVKHRAATYYRRDATVVYPPFDISHWQSMLSASSDAIVPKEREYYLFVGRLEPYKRVDLLIEVFNKLQYPLVIVGTGSRERALKKRARPSISFISGISDEHLAGYYKNARALIMPQEEEFGYTAIEAQFAGLPVISYKQSAVSEIIQDGKTGILFENQTGADIYNAIARFEQIEYNMKSVLQKSGSEQGKRFSKEKFITAFQNAIKP